MRGNCCYANYGTQGKQDQINSDFCQWLFDHFMSSIATQDHILPRRIKLSHKKAIKNYVNVCLNFKYVNLCRLYYVRPRAKIADQMKIVGSNEHSSTFNEQMKIVLSKERSQSNAGSWLASGSGFKTWRGRDQNSQIWKQPLFFAIIT